MPRTRRSEPKPCSSLPLRRRRLPRGVRDDVRLVCSAGTTSASWNRHPLRRHGDSEERDDSADDDTGDLQPTEDVSLADPERVGKSRDRRTNGTADQENYSQRS